MMQFASKHQSGGSLLGNILMIALFAYGVYLGIQYVPQLIESQALDSVLESVESQNRTQKYESPQQVEQAIKSMLNLNQMDDMIKHIQLRDSSQGISVEINYERELDLLFEKKALAYSKVLDLH